MKRLIILATLLATSQGLAATCPAVQKLGPDFILEGREQRLFGQYAFDKDLTAVTKMSEPLKTLSTMLRRNGAEVLVVQMPSASVVHRDQIDWKNPELNGYSPDQWIREYKTLMSFYDSIGMTSLDAFEVAEQVRQSGKNFFYLRDHHWSSTGAKAIADEVAKIIKNKFQKSYSTLDQNTYTLSQKNKYDQKGTFGKVLKDKCGMDTPLEQTVVYKVNESYGNLLGGETQIGIYGDSHGEEAFSFLPYLEVNTGLSSTNYSVSGGGYQDSLMDYFLHRTPDEPLPAFMIWLFGAHIFSDGTYVFDQLLPTASSSFGKDTLLSTQKINDTKAISLPSTSDGKIYAKFSLSDLSATKFAFDIVDTVGKIKSISISRSPRIKNTGAFYYRLPSDSRSIAIKNATGEISFYKSNQF